MPFFNIEYDPEQEITRKLLEQIAGSVSVRDEVPLRLIYRAFRWASDEIAQLDQKIESVRGIVNPPPLVRDDDEE